MTSSSRRNHWRHLRRVAPCVALLALVACTETPTDPLPPNPDGGPGGGSELGVPDMAIQVDVGFVPDNGFPPGQDTDADGLCDSREWSIGTQLDDSDSDDDGIPDYYEYVSGMNPRRPDIPATEDLIFLTELAGETRTVPIRRSVFANGEDYAGAFVGITVSDPDGIGSADFYVDADATVATPAGNVAFVDVEAERYFGVVDRTELGYEIHFEAPAGLIPRGCLRVYPFRYDIKRSDGRLVAVERRFLVMVPVGGALGSSPWCAPSFCI